ncbi:MAG: hypothetical protein IM588_09810 [Cytophagales bacterium]|nr:hypothetical protein [Cytophagales bacterium]
MPENSESKRKPQTGDHKIFFNACALTGKRFGGLATLIPSAHVDILHPRA